MKNTLLCSALLVVLLAVAPASGAIVSGFRSYGGYGSANSIYQYKFADTAANSQFLGKMDLAALLGYDPVLQTGNAPNGDIAMLSDRKIALTHTDGSGNRVVSVIELAYNVDGTMNENTASATVHQTYTIGDGTGGAWRVAPLPDKGFVVVRGTGGSSAPAYVYQEDSPGSNSWSPTTVTGTYKFLFDVAGLVAPNDTQYVTGEYVSPPGGTSRSGQKYDITGKIAKYYDSTTSPYRGWGYGLPGEGLRTDLLDNGWVIEGESTPIGSVVFDGTESDGLWHDGRVGEILNADQSQIFGHYWAALDDGRIVTPWVAGYQKTNITWHVYTLVEDPTGQPLGSVGATGEDWEGVLGDGSVNDNLVGQWAGDYMFAPSIAPEPATMALLGLGGLVMAGTAARRRRRR